MFKHVALSRDRTSRDAVLEDRLLKLRQEEEREDVDGRALAVAPLQVFARLLLEEHRKPGGWSGEFEGRPVVLFRVPDLELMRVRMALRVTV
jgi:hypothetical protein